MQTLSTALNKATNLVQAKISKVAGLTKPQAKFLLWLYERWLMFPVRYNFLNHSRYGGYFTNSDPQPVQQETALHSFISPVLCKPAAKRMYSRF